MLWEETAAGQLDMLINAKATKSSSRHEVYEAGDNHKADACHIVSEEK
jgi:hypothetical protein